MTAESSHDLGLGKDGSSAAAALKGASMAFQASGKPPVKPKPLVNTYSGTNGALAAATKVGGTWPNALSRQSSISRLDAEEGRLAHQRSGGSFSNYGPTSPYTPGSSHLDPHTGFLQLPDGERKSPSFIAATLAASRSVTPNHTGQQQQQLSAAQQNQLSAALKRQGSYSSVRSGSSRASSEPQTLDTTSIPPTGSLIGMFEQNAVNQNKRPGIRRAGTADQKGEVRTKRARTPSPRVAKARKEETKATVDTPTPRSPRPRIERTRKPEIKSPKPTLPSTFSSRVIEASKPPEIKSPKPTLPSVFSNRTLETPKLPLSPHKTSLTKAKPDPPKQIQAIRKTSIPASKPIPIPPKPRHAKEQPPSDDDASSEDSFVSATEYRPSFRAELHNQNNRRLASSSSPSTPSNAAIDSLANAIVASSLASSRAASPSRTTQSLAPPPPPRRNQHHLFHHSREPDISRTPSPGKPSVLRTTMRKPRDESEDEGDKRRGKKSHLMKKHPNKHHEGDRKRWRDVVTERERKRYEAVWASNRGLYTSANANKGGEGENGVNSLVVRDIFSRSRLHNDVLEEVYELVDRGRNGTLRKEEFVVGLWLIDQRLKGRKLPIRVQDSVWRSVGSSGGIKVKSVGK